MKYDHNSTYPPEWKNNHLKELFKNIKAGILNKRCPIENYDAGEMPHDQLLHTDYPPRK